MTLWSDQNETPRSRPVVKRKAIHVPFGHGDAHGFCCCSLVDADLP